MLTLDYRTPFAWDALLGFLADRATPGVELVEHGAYSRTVEIGESAGWVRVQPTATKPTATMPTATKPTAAHSASAQRLINRHALHVEISASLTPVVGPLAAALRDLFDLDAAPFAIEATLAKHGLAAHVSAIAGLRVPGAMDGFELALRAILGQQVSVKGATTLAGRFAQQFGQRIETDDERLRHGAPSATRIADADIAQLRALGVTSRRAESIRALARAVAGSDLLLGPGADVDKVIPQLLSLPGIGEWTAQYVAMRALRWPDGFPASDLWLRRAAGNVSAAELTRFAERWRPWRAYAAMHLWRGIGAGRVVSVTEHGT